jgi:choline dehydrogenase
MYDYVIVGAGSAGCVLAARLSEDPDVKVCLLEAGPADSADLIHIPAAFSALFRSRFDWDHSTIDEPQLNGRRIYLPRGRMLGGSSSINAMVYIRGNRADYDEWRDAYGCEGWGFDDLLPYFKRSEDNERGEDAFHGAGGPLPVCDGRSNNEMSHAFVDAAVAYGLPANDDFNGPEQDGAGFYQCTQRDGFRGSAAAAYLRPAMDRPNLTVETHAQALRILFDGDRAIGVEALRLDDVFNVMAGQEVIVAGGAYNSPHLLQLSGIGRPEELELLQIPVVADVPGVGLNLSDHINAGAVFTASKEVSLLGALNDDNLALLQSEGRGPLTSNVAEAGGFLRTTEGLAAPDIQLHFAPAIFEAGGLSPAQAHGLSLGACLLKPASRGQVAVASPDPTAKPLIIHNYLAEPEDLATLVRGVRAVMEIMATEPVAGYVAGPYNAPESLDDAALVAQIRKQSQTLYHPVGSCSMGTGDTAVVDTALRVRGTEGLRVVDASVMPTVPRGNTNAPTIALAERAADLIKGVQPLRAGEVAAAA